MKRIVDFIHTQNSLACLQIAHAGTFPPSIINVRLANPLLKGRKASTYPPLLTFPRNREGMTEKDGGWQVVAPSPYVYYIILFPTTGLTQMLFYRVAWSEATQLSWQRRRLKRSCSYSPMLLAGPTKQSPMPLKFMWVVSPLSFISYSNQNLQGAHGYLISSFNSPIANKRTDEYGGDFEGRTRFCREVGKLSKVIPRIPSFN